MHTTDDDELIRAVVEHVVRDSCCAICINHVASSAFVSLLNYVATVPDARSFSLARSTAARLAEVLNKVALAQTPAEFERILAHGSTKQLTAAPDLPYTVN